MHSILIIEDNLVNLKVTRVSLELEGFEVCTATTAVAALSILEHFKPTLILMDIQLPDMNGLELTRQIRANTFFHDIVIIAITAYAMKGDKEKMLVAGCNDYLAKPFDSEELLKVINQYLNVSANIEK